MNKVELAVIDDDEMYVLALKKLIEKTNLSERTVYFGNGEDALNYLDQCINKASLLPELILLDMNMPVTNGWQFIKEFRKLKTRIDKDITIYMVSSDVTEDVVKRASEITEITEFVCKPVSFTKLVDILNKRNLN